MIRPATASKVLLVADRRLGAPEAGRAPMRRFRLARLCYEGRPTVAAGRGGQFKPV